MVLSPGHGKRAKNLAVASATASHVGTVLPRPRPAQADGAHWQPGWPGTTGDPREACAGSYGAHYMGGGCSPRKRLNTRHVT